MLNNFLQDIVLLHDEICKTLVLSLALLCYLEIRVFFLRFFVEPLSYVKQDGEIIDAVKCRRMLGAEHFRS